MFRLHCRQLRLGTSPVASSKSITWLRSSGKNSRSLWVRTLHACWSAERFYFPPTTHIWKAFPYLPPGDASNRGYMLPKWYTNFIRKNQSNTFICCLIICCEFDYFKYYKKVQTFKEHFHLKIVKKVCIWICTTFFPYEYDI